MTVPLAQKNVVQFQQEISSCETGYWLLGLYTELLYIYCEWILEITYITTCCMYICIYDIYMYYSEWDNNRFKYTDFNMNYSFGLVFHFDIRDYSE